MSRKRSRLTGTEALEQEFAKVDHAPLLAALGVDLPHDILTPGAHPPIIRQRKRHAPQ